MTLFVKLPGLPASLSVALIAPITSNAELMVHSACLHGDDAKNDITFNVFNPNNAFYSFYYYTFKSEYPI